MWFIFLLSFGFVTVSSSGVPQILQSDSPVLDSFVQRLHSQKWDEEEKLCLENTLTILENVKNSTLWATWIWNANTIPSGNLYGSSTNLGNFDQCIKPPWLVTHPQFSTKYCIAKFLLANSPKLVAEFDPYGSTTDFINSKTILGLATNRLYWGVCMPVACNPPSIVKITRAMYEITNFERIRPNITVDYCQVAGEKPQYTTSFYLFLTLIALLIIIVAASTFYRNYMAKNDQYSDDSVQIISKSFCIVQNYQNLTKKNEQEIRVMNGMKFITALMVIILHEVFALLAAGVSNLRDCERDARGVSVMIIHIDVVVDTFFAMSGLLYIKGLLANADRHQNLFMVLWKRYLRLIGPFALCIFYVTAVSKYTGSGPMWPLYNDLETKVCFKTWKLSLLMLNYNTRDICHAVTWYLSSEYQLAIVATIIFYFYRKDRKLGFAAFGTAAVFSLIVPGVLTYWYQLPGIHFMDMSKYLHDVRDYWEVSYTYTPSFSRAGSYFVGVAMGYLMTVCKPADYRKIIPKTWSILGTTASLAVMVCVMALGLIYIGREYYPLENAVTAATNRVAWGIAVCCIIGFCEYGTVPLVTEILSSSIFTPLSRLSYSLYLIHPLIIQRNKLSLRSPLKYDIFSIVTDVVGTSTVSLGFSFIMWLLVEAPMINLCNQLFFAKQKCKSKESEKNGVLQQNGKLKAKGL